jgi:hypothetical protein
MEFAAGTSDTFNMGHDILIADHLWALTSTA